MSGRELPLVYRLNLAKIILENIVASNIIPLDKHALKRLILMNFPFSE